jgi:hypothetical protein
VVKGLSVQLPQLGIGLCCNSGRAGSVIKEGKLTEGLAWVILFQESWCSLTFL